MHNKLKRVATRPPGGVARVREHEPWEAFLATSEAATVVADAAKSDFPVVFVNPAFERLTGYYADEVIGRNCRFLQLGDRDQPQLKEVRLAIARRRAARVVLRNYRKDGGVFHNELTLTPMRDAAGAVTHFLAALRDVSAERELASTVKWYQTLVEHQSALCMLLDPDGRIRYQSPAYERALGFAAQGLRGSWLEEWLHPQDVSAVKQVFRHLQAKGLPHGEIEFRLKHRDGGWRSFLASVANSVATPEVQGFIVNAVELGRRTPVEDPLAEPTTRDSLTGLPNLRLLSDRLTQAIAKAKRRKEKVALLFVDLDHFKTINDSLGRAAGDEVLIETARRLTAVVRAHDTVARLAGDEFVIVIEAIRDAIAVATLCEKILATVREPLVVESTRILVTASAGVAWYPDSGEDRDRLLRHADQAMYQAKEAGRNVYHFFQQAQEREVRRELETRTELLLAVQRDEFRMVFQPVFDTRSRAFCGAEALVRWQHPQRGTVMPGEFIASAEESGLIRDIGHSALAKACAQWATLQALSGGALPVSVNLSARQFRDPSLPERIESVLRATGLRADLLELEITETDFMRNVEQTRQSLDRITALGIGIVLDDFGIGYSSLGYLKRFRVKKIKIDQSFIQDIGRNANSEQLIDSMIALAHKLGISIVAEGVETEQQIEFLDAAGCDFVQGFLLAPPRPSDALFGGMLH